MLKKLMAFREAYLRDESGATAIEYGLIAATMAVILVTGLAIFGGDITAMFNRIGETLDPTPPEPSGD